MKFVVKAIVKFLINIIGGIFTPLDNLILDFLPSFAVPIAFFGNLLNWLKDFILWVLSWLPFDSDLWAWFIGYLVIKITASLAISLIKLVVHWWHALAP